MQRVFVTWAPDASEVRRFAEEVRAALEVPEFPAQGRPAAVASITDIAAADLLLFGIGRSDAELPTDYAELARVFSGANLAGKAAACFSASPATASTTLRRLLRSTGISLLEEEPSFGEKTGRSELREWAARVREFARGVADGRR